eukprot:jgi/Picsp_1/2872/NSC_01097-R1_protein
MSMRGRGTVVVLLIVLLGMQLQKCLAGSHDNFVGGAEGDERMSFIQRVANYLLHEVLVDTLANNKAFQRFAIRSNALLSDVSKKTTEHGSDVGQKSAEFFSVFKEELKKGMGDIYKK